MSSDAKQWLLEIVLMVLAVIALASAPARGTAERAHGASVRSHVSVKAVPAAGKAAAPAVANGRVNREG